MIEHAEKNTKALSGKGEKWRENPGKLLGGQKTDRGRETRDPKGNILCEKCNVLHSGWGNENRRVSLVEICVLCMAAN